MTESCRKPDQKLQPQDVSEDEVDETTVFVRKQKDKNDNIMIDEGIMTDPVLVQNYSRIRYSFVSSAFSLMDYVSTYHGLVLINSLSS